MKKVIHHVLKSEKPADLPSFGLERSDLPFSTETYLSRLLSVRHKMKEEGIDILLVRKPEDLRWLTNFHTIGDFDNQTLLVNQTDPPAFVCRLLEARLIDKLSWVSVWYSNEDSLPLRQTLVSVLRKQLDALSSDGQKNVVALDHGVVFADDLQALEAGLKLELRNSDHLIEKIRLVREREEVDMIRKAARITDQGIAAGRAAICAGALESDIFLASMTGLVRHGSEEPGYAPIVRTSEWAGHGTWEVGKRVGRGLVFLEMSGNVSGYHAPMMRTFYVTKEGTVASVPAWVLEAEALILEAIERTLPMFKPGTRACEIDAVAREILLRNSFGGTVVARTGYTAGGTACVPTGYAGWGDACCSLSGSNEQVLKENQTFHFIPWLQKISGQETGPVGLSEAVLVTPEGGLVLGGTPRRLEILSWDGREVQRGEVSMEEGKEDSHRETVMAN
uniref:Peptidase M24 domain-containing protein n=1 Tax=Chromera velia CCMP2878 TaxID=1169474 RepID=A0A0G4FXE2_9ALVE|eukprot:Cvel_3846.t1-p1 / transcript=Cvel_3846.t1 / gene=Cvel_3846 / organism=Chromera_velia_CCMP2878 / gene_product=Uncharacterized hydrolase/peptidase y4tM, putative / transcript_product=Uncharacterized hydrolase/peptidase y4tM, putative / location=Cvel_scaffold162:107016-108840(-) / protein_length=448 / sequence_SO=supercontig / SO=protein_coding / is_pseudo=false